MSEIWKPQGVTHCKPTAVGCFDLALLQGTSQKHMGMPKTNSVNKFGCKVRINRRSEEARNRNPESEDLTWRPNNRNDNSVPTRNSFW